MFNVYSKVSVLNNFTYIVAERMNTKKREVQKASNDSIFRALIKWKFGL